MGNQTPQQKAISKNTDRANIEQKQNELRGAQQKGNANTGQNQNPGKGAPQRHLTPDNANMSKNKKSGHSDGEGVHNQREDAALVKEQIRSRDA